MGLYRRNSSCSLYYSKHVVVIVNLILFMSQFVVAIMQCDDARIIESGGNAIVQCTRSGATFSSVSFSVSTRPEPIMSA